MSQFAIFISIDAGGKKGIILKSCDKGNTSSGTPEDIYFNFCFKSRFSAMILCSNNSMGMQSESSFNALRDELEP